MPSQTAAPPGVTDDLLTELADARERTLALVAHLDDDALERVHSPLMSPLVWDLGHIAAFEDLWLAHRHGGLPLLRPDLAEVYDAFETPRAGRGALPFLRRADALAHLAAVRERTLAVADRLGELELELVLRHEQQHAETMLQTMALAHLPAPPAAAAPPARTAARWTGLELVEVPAGRHAIGAPAYGFAYDNERPRHGVELAAFRIGRTPVTNGAYLAFVEDGGYGRREHWSEEGWAWRTATGAERPAGWTDDGRAWRMDRCEPLPLDHPVEHVSWFEADAFARAHGARLPTEAEWEAAARALPGSPGTLDQRTFGTGPAVEGGWLGDVWEWTASGFDGYPGFVAHPYPEYSEVFFGGDHRVLRGGSWATRERVASPSFRNWDHPQRRQIFAGLRIAEDA